MFCVFRRTLWSTSYGCEGVDLNRNWDWHWGEVGASQDPCDETFAGSKAFSEPETRAVSEFILDHRDRIQVTKSNIIIVNFIT